MTSPTPEERADGLVTLFLDDLIKNANQPPGLREAIVARLAGRVDDIGQRFGQQIDHLRSPSARRIPNAYLADEEAVENELQAAAAGIRTARALEGVLSDPRRFERNLAQRLAPNIRWALRSEASRVPRPPTRASVLNWSLTPVPWVEDDAEWPPAGAVALADVRQLTGEDGELVRVIEEPYRGWVQLGMFERQATLATRYPDVPARQLLIATGLEACDGSPPVNSMPISHTAPNPWAVRYDRLAPSLDAEHARITINSTQGPLAALIDYKGQLGSPAPERGVGLQPFALVPRIEVIALLGLRPEAPALRHALVDDHGAAIVGRQWRGFLIHDGNYSPLEPAIYGADLLLRPDLYETLVNAVGNGRFGFGVSVNHFESAPSSSKPEGGD
ncbi:hypothetical protein [Actinomadura fibrosa]|uniref:Uncharacterized protein n=1 Tax=Actinomadura fibrosa TaxID=111802 RepID=A0ABW2XXC7_9ACTN|nr:hypothetical protein [Actinomadura fibrosa]